MKKLIVLMTALLVIIASLSYAADYYVTNVSEINAVMPQLTPGDTITLAEGIWTDAHIVFQANGAEGDTILMRAENPGYVLLNGTSTLRISGNYLKVDGLRFEGGYSQNGAVIEFRNGSSNLSSHCRLTNTAIINYNPPSSGTDYKWISLYGSYNRVDHCYLRGKAHSGTTLVVWLSAQPNYHRIDHNYFAYRPELGYNGGETIRVGTSDWSMYDSYTVVEYNYFERCNGEVEIISNKSCENIYRYNTFVECEGALTLRHGNRCTVESNFFFGKGNGKAGGVRVIGEDHKIFNNYFQDLKGSSNRAALSIMNGIPNSPLNGYWQVKRAEITYNTFYNCENSIIIGRGASSTQSLPPKDCKIGNNIVVSNYQLITQEAQPENLTWLGNIMYGGPLGIPQPQGIQIVDPKLIWAADSLWRPDPSLSPAIGTAVDSFAYVVDDVDGHPRTGAKDVGCDQHSTAPPLRRPLRPSDVGPNWFPLPPLPQHVVPVEAGVDSLRSALMNAQDGDVLELVSDGGIYENTDALVIDKHVIIRAAESLLHRPIIRNISSSGGTRAVFEMRGNGFLELKGVELDGMAQSATPAKYLIRTDDDPFSSTYSLFADDCYFHDVVSGSDGNFFRAYPGTKADTIRFTNCLFKTAGKEGIRLKDEAAGSGLYNVEYFEMTNCTMWDVPKEAVYIYAGDDVPFTPGPKIVINHCTFDSCGYDNSHIINALEADGTVIKNSIFSKSSNSGYAVQLFGYGSSISYSDLYEVGSVSLNRNATMGGGMLSLDPQYQDRQSGDFHLKATSPLWYKADDSTAMGDLRWAANPPVGIFTQDDLSLPDDFILNQNFPNPFNPETTIQYSLTRQAKVELKIFDVRGKLIATLVNGKQPAGNYSVRWNAANISSGVYMYQLSVNGVSVSKKMLLLK